MASVVEVNELKRTYRTTTGSVRRRARARGRRLLASVAGLVATELGIAVAYACAGYLLFRALEAGSQRRAVLDSF